MLPQLKKLQDLIDGQNTSDLKNQSRNLFFKGKAKLAGFFAGTKTALTIVDTHIDATTFACIEGVKKPIRFLVGQSEKDVIDQISGFLTGFRAGGHELELRRHLQLNDRFFIFNGRCWMASCSLVDLDQSTLSVIECVDTKSVIVKEIGRKWREGKVFLK
jgi:hypothetical protein